MGERAIHELLEDFITIFAQLQFNVVNVVRPHLLSSGVLPEAIEAHLVELDAEVQSVKQLCEVATAETIATVGSGKGNIKLEEWVQDRAKFPKVFDVRHYFDTYYINKINV